MADGNLTLTLASPMDFSKFPFDTQARMNIFTFVFHFRHVQKTVIIQLMKYSDKNHNAAIFMIVVAFLDA